MILNLKDTRRTLMTARDSRIGGYVHEHHHAQPWSWVPVMPAAVRGADQ